MMLIKQLALTKEQARRLRAVAAQRRVSEADLLQEALAQVLGGEDGPPDEEARRLALSAIGMFDSGQPDLAERHDDYFAAAVEQ
ncbi:MAG: CopG family transcriptional regulator [Armatimonadetes bacterium]|nr:CopG family transcriptional regulator [Armatimonadota bacterium]